VALLKFVAVLQGLSAGNLMRARLTAQHAAALRGRSWPLDLAVLPWLTDEVDEL
jgi:hypothetical protein